MTDRLTTTFALVLCAALPGVVSIGWMIDHSNQRREIIKWQCKFEAIDPIRWEAGLPMSECCK